MVRVSLSNAKLATEFYEQGAELTPFDWMRPETYARALVGIKTVFCTMPHITDGLEKFRLFTRACQTAGVKHVVKLSFTHAMVSEADTMVGMGMARDKNDPFLRVPLVRMHRACDQRLMKLGHASSLHYTILFASHFMSNPAVYQGESLRRDHVFYGASHGQRVNYVSPNDVAEVSVRILLYPKTHYNVGYNLAGPEAITDGQVAQHLGAQLGLGEIKYIDQEDTESFLSRISDPDWGPVQDVADLEQLKATGVEDKLPTRGDIVKICGHTGQNFGEYLQAKQLMSPLEVAPF